MGALRFQLINSIIGPFTVEKADPIGTNSLTKKVKRSKDNDGVVYEIVIDIDMIKEARDYCIASYEQGGGIDAIVIVNIFQRNENARRWELYFTGTINFNKFDVYEEKTSIAIEQTGLQRSVMNALDFEVDLEATESRNGSALPTQTTFNIPFHSKTILKEMDARTGQKNDAGGIDYLEKQQLDVIGQTNLPGLSTTYRERVAYGAMATDRKVRAELTEAFDIPFGWSDMETMGITGPADVADYLAWLEANPTYGRPGEIYRATEAGEVEIDINLPLKHKIEVVDISGDIDTCGDIGALGQIELHAWVEIRNSDDEIQDIQHIGAWDMAGCGDFERESSFETKSLTLSGVNLLVGWKVYVYTTTRIYADYENQDIGSEDISHHFYVTAQDGYQIVIRSATQYPATNSKVVLLHEAFQRCCQYITNQTDCFRSSLVGRPEIVLPDAWESDYVSDGVAALIAWTNGNNIRERDKPIITTLEELFRFMDMAFYTGFGFETVAGQQILVLEKREYFFRKNEKILSLGKVASPKKSVASDRYAKKIEYGYAGKIDIGQVNAIDEFNTLRKSETPIVNTKNSINKSVKTIAGGYVIEYQRRLSDKTEDGKKDDDNFVVCVVRDGDSFKTKKDEGYTLIENVYDSPSGYNYDISPARCLINQFPQLASMLIRSTSKLIKFSGGEVNYLMRTQKTGEAVPVEENGTFDLTEVEPIWDNETYTLANVPFSREQMQLVDANPYGYIEFKDRFDNLFEGFILEIEHKPNEGTADFELLKVYR